MNKPQTADDWNREQGVVKSSKGHDAISYLEGYQHGRADMAQELVGKLEELDKHHRFGFEDGTLLIYKEDWQTLRKKIGGSCTGSE